MQLSLNEITDKYASRHIVYHNRIFFIPMSIVVNDLLKLSLNSYAAKDTICVLFFLTKKTQKYAFKLWRIRKKLMSDLCTISHFLS
jgi:hypothetical protein